jgi:hypothetical protein
MNAAYNEGIDMVRSDWLDEETQEVKIDDYAKQLTSFIDALADGRVDDAELEAQEKRVAETMKEVEPHLDDELHAKVTKLLCELSALNIMQLMHTMDQARTKTTFRG